MNDSKWILNDSINVELFGTFLFLKQISDIERLFECTVWELINHAKKTALRHQKSVLNKAMKFYLHAYGIFGKGCAVQN
jgi:hypothetical protein